jgi:hypothetical protein
VNETVVSPASIQAGKLRRDAADALVTDFRSGIRLAMTLSLALRRIVKCRGGA